MCSLFRSNSLCKGSKHLLVKHQPKQKGTLRDLSIQPRAVLFVWYIKIKDNKYKIKNWELYGVDLTFWLFNTLSSLSLSPSLSLSLSPFEYKKIYQLCISLINPPLLTALAITSWKNKNPFRIGTSHLRERKYAYSCMWERVCVCVDMGI